MARRARARTIRSRTPTSPGHLCDRAVVAITGSIGALWAAQFVLMLRADGHVRSVRVIMSRSATEFVTPTAMRAIAGEPVLAGLFDADAPFPIGHVQVSEDADVLVVMPATANVIGKVAAGLADDVVSASILAAACPVIVVPNMNDRMWRRPVVQRNIRTLTGDGYHVVPPVEGVVVSTGRPATGGMPPFETILKAMRRVLTKSPALHQST
jgi:phosphopantothenoylcysteine decarboxylase/phosphopantothenate--cysteine ligase